MWRHHAPRSASPAEPPVEKFWNGPRPPCAPRGRPPRTPPTRAGAEHRPGSDPQLHPANVPVPPCGATTPLARPLPPSPPSKNFGTALGPHVPRADDPPAPLPPAQGQSIDRGVTLNSTPQTSPYPHVAPPRPSLGLSRRAPRRKILERP